MKKLHLILIAAVAVCCCCSCACHNNSPRPAPSSREGGFRSNRNTCLNTCSSARHVCSRRPDFRTGDLVFAGLPETYKATEGSMSEAISASTSGGRALRYIHVAMIEMVGDSVYIVDATDDHGVARRPVDEFLKDFTLRDGSYAVCNVMRCSDRHAARNAMRFAAQYIGEPYDNQFLPANGMHYCSELVYDCFFDRKGKPTFSSQPMNFKGPDGEFPSFWKNWFEKAGCSIPQDVPGTNPQTMSGEECLKLVGSLVGN